MTRTIHSDGNLMPVTVTGSEIAGGTPVLLGDAFGIMVATTPVGGTGVLALGGVHELAAAAPQAWTQGAKLYWDDGASEVTTTATSNREIGTAWADKLSAATVGLVRLNGVGLPAAG